MQSRLNPYLHFDGNARQAIEFYESVFGGKVSISTFKEFQASPNPSYDNKIMHSELQTDHGFSLMCGDIMEGMGMEHSQGSNFTISLSGDNEAELRGYWNKLAAGATIPQPLEQAPWGDTFGMLTDKFGIPWMVNITAKRG